MAVPRNRSSKSKSLSRRSHSAMAKTAQAKCPNCGAIHPHHKMCNSCGYYGGRLISKKESE